MGAQDPPDINDAVGMLATRDSRPIHRVYVDGLWIDKTEVHQRAVRRLREGDRIGNGGGTGATRRGFPWRTARMRGGSFLCTDQYCSRYMVGTRGKGDISTGTSHLGVRTVSAPARRVG